LVSGIGRPGRAASARVDAPVVDQLVVREITDNQHNPLFFCQLAGSGAPGRPWMPQVN
jgi:hypothetical protein